MTLASASRHSQMLMTSDSGGKHIRSGRDLTEVRRRGNYMKGFMPSLVVLGSLSE